MNIYEMSDKAITKQLGQQLRHWRLTKNISQSGLAERVLLAENTIKAMEKGQGKLSTLLAVLRELNQLQALDNLLQAPLSSPLERAKLQAKQKQGKQRQRASRRSAGDNETDNREADSEW